MFGGLKRLNNERFSEFKCLYTAYQQGCHVMQFIDSPKRLSQGLSRKRFKRGLDLDVFLSEYIA